MVQNFNSENLVIAFAPGYC